MSVTACPARATASCAAATNDRPTGNRRNSDVCDKNPRRGDGELPNMTYSFPGNHFRPKSLLVNRSRSVRVGKKIMVVGGVSRRA